ncbi:MAG: glycosyltransferase family 39 protein [Planctomycetales bacterium]|nr:glycosyltransferase family 39 protein [Planctomycetales bacterium]
MRSTVKVSDATVRLIAFCLLGVALAAAGGRLSVHTVNDTPSYLNYPLGSLHDALLSIRTPGYPIFLAVVSATVGLQFVPVIQVLLHAVVSWFFGEELIRRGMPLRGAIAAAVSVMIGCTAVDHIQTISTDAPAASLGVLTATFLMRACRTSSLADMIACAVVATATIFVRPAYLFLIPWIAFAGWLLVERPARRTIGLRIAIAVALVVLGWMSMRKIIVSEFAIAPFGHQNLSAILVQTVTPETLRQLPGESGDLGRMIADQLERDGYQLPADNAGGIPTLTMETQWDVINYGVVWPIARDRYADQDALGIHAPAVLVHRRIGALNGAILSASPRGYLRWIVLAIRRSVWGTAANIAMHPIFLPIILAGLVWVVIRSSQRIPLSPIVLPEGWAALAIVAITYAAMGIGFVILSSPPLGRFADAAAIFLPGLVASLFVGGRPVIDDGGHQSTSPRSMTSR